MIGIKHNSINVHSFFVFISYFLLVFSCIVGYEKLKYLSVLILLAIIIYSFKNKQPKKYFILVAIIIMFFITLSIIFQDISIGQAISSLMYYVVLLFISFGGYRIFERKKDIQFGLYALIIATILILLDSKSEIIYQYGVLSQYIGRVRVYGKFNHVNTLAYLCATILITSLILIYIKKNLFKNNILNKITWFSIIIGFSIVLFLTDSRGAMAFVGTFYLMHIYDYWIEKSKLSKKSKVLISILLFFVIAILFLDNIFHYIFSQATFQNRMAVFYEIDGNFLQKLFGRGMIAANSIDYSNITGYMEIAWVNIFYKSGIIGVISFVFIFLVLYYNSLKLFKGNKKIARNLLLAIIVTTLVESVITSIFNLVPLFIWPLLSLICQINLINNNS